MGKNAVDPATSSIPTFYAGSSIFITGATGFLGKVLIEKLLRSCPDIREIFLLIRPKVDANIDERLRQLLTNPLFDTLRREQPHCFDKLTPVEGDIRLEDLGLSVADRNMLIEKTSVIFHVAAIVRFDNTLKDSVFMNVRSTRDICVLGKQMKRLAVLVHVSTAYAYVDKLVIDEILYPVEDDWRKMIQIAEAVDKDVLEVFKAKYIGPLPNQYIFTKRLAEQVIIDYSGSLPCVICRPSIVSPTLNEPVKGWLDNFNGSVGLLVAIGKGTLKVALLDPDTRDNYVPVDIVIKALIVAAWKHGSRITNAQDNLPVVYNCTGNDSSSPGHTMMLNIGKTALKKIPLEEVIGAPYFVMIRSPFLYYVLMLLLTVPIFFIDRLLLLSGRQSRLLKVHRKIFTVNATYAYFMLNDWKLRNQKMLSLSDEVPADDQRTFGYAVDLTYNYDKPSYLENSIIGAKIYLLNESMDRLESTRLHYNRIIWIDKIARTLIGILLLWIIYGIVM